MENHNPFSLKNKTILVVGASSGIGQSIAIEASRMGAHVVISARNEAKLQATLAMMEGDGHQIIVADITSNCELEVLVEGVPQLSGVVLSAGVGMTLPMLFSSRDKYDTIFNVNFFAPVELTRLLIRKKKLEKYGSIVIISSVGGVTKYNLGNSIYGTSKAAINSFMHFCAKEIAPKKIRVNSINPGMVQTDLLKGGTLTEADFEKDIRENYPLGRYGEPKDVAFGAIYLLSDASSWVTGHSLVIDGGFTL